MKKYFLYELRKNLIPLIILTVIATIFFLIFALTIPFRLTTIILNPGVPNPPNTSLIGFPIFILITLCTIVPIIMFHFKMHSRQVDCLYSMPLKKEKIYLTKSFIGLILTFVPFTVAFWLGVAVIAARTANGIHLTNQVGHILQTEYLNFIGYFITFLIALPLGTMLFGINAFIFTRANKVIDGIIFIILWSTIFAQFWGMVSLMYLTSIPNNLNYPLALQSFWWFTYSPLAVLGIWQSSFIRGTGNDVMTTGQGWISFIIASVMGIGAWIGLFLSPRFEKAENAERISSSPFGYASLIPAYFIIGLAVSGIVSPFSIAVQFVLSVLCCIGAVIGYIIYRRGVKFKPVDGICLGSAFIVGIILSLLFWSTGASTS